MPQMTVALIFSRLDHPRPNSFIARTAIQMLTKRRRPAAMSANCVVANPSFATSQIGRRAGCTA
jgi:hypothetical protein